MISEYLDKKIQTVDISVLKEYFRSNEEDQKLMERLLTDVPFEEFKLSLLRGFARCSFVDGNRKNPFIVNVSGVTFHIIVIEK